MKKTLKLLVILASALILLTGCAKMDYTVDIKEDGKAEVSYIVAIENEYLESSSNTTTSTDTDSTSLTSLGDTDYSSIYLESLESEAKRAESKGYTTEKFKDDKYTGYTITKSFDKVEDISLQDAFGDNIIKNSDDGKIKFEKNGSNVKISQEATFDLSQYTQGYEIIYSVNLPVKVKENNATKVDGNKLTWELTGKSTADVNFKAEGGTSILNSGSALTIVLLVVGIVVVLAVVLVVVLCIVNSKKKKKSNVAPAKTEENK